MDLAARITSLTGAGVDAVEAIGGQHLCRHYRVRLATGQDVFVKASVRPVAGLRSEACGLRWLAGAEAVPVPGVLGCDEHALVLAWVPPGAPDTAAAERFGRDLARLHTSGPAAGTGEDAAERPAFGAPWPGFIASLPLDNTLTSATGGWPQWYATRRLLPFLRRAVDAGLLGRADAALAEAVIARTGELAGPAEPPSRIHGDCWAGNVLWSGGRGWLIDPAAHGGHRETDLAMLALFGAPHLDRILAAYDEAAPLAPGWQGRVPLHQMHPLLVHVCLFGAGYAGSLRAAARAALSA